MGSEMCIRDRNTTSNCTDGYTLERIWTATDNCGNSVTHTQTITVADIESPVLNGVPTNITASCDVSSIPAVATGITASDNCDTDVDITYSETIVPGSCPDSYTIERTWTATDIVEIQYLKRKRFQ